MFFINNFINILGQFSQNDLDRVFFGIFGTVLFYAIIDFLIFVFPFLLVGFCIFYLIFSLEEDKKEENRNKKKNRKKVAKK